jgi:hypothetical protein
MGRILNNLLSGAASVLLLIPTGAAPQVRPVTEGRSDRDALRGDMVRIRGDFDKALIQIEKQVAA